MLLFLSVLSLSYGSGGALPEPSDPLPPQVCLSPEEVNARILEPLILLRECQRERALFDATADRLATVARSIEIEREAERRRATRAEERATRARRSRPLWGAGGAGGALALVLLLLLL